MSSSRLSASPKLDWIAELSRLEDPSARRKLLREIARSIRPNWWTDCMTRSLAFRASSCGVLLTLPTRQCQ